MSERLSLALDIGTRKVVGLLTKPGPKGLKIVAAEKLEHSTRAMYDGQIHDVMEVANVVGQIVKKLAAKAGAPLTEAAVAAAGRALRTFRGTATRELTGLTELTQSEVFALELEAVQGAQAAMAAALKDQEQPQDYHYVGHSVMSSRLDGLTIGNLVGQRGNLAELDVIATFLPRGVVDSLQSVLGRNNLEMTALTLEPIAALSVAVPPSMRHLNLVLVDIGAGTSDIAITSKGAVTAYDMVPVAGDEVTEALSEAYLLDFAVGETVKRQINQKEEVTFTDILGHKQTIASEALRESLQAAVEGLAGRIADRVLKLNGGVPQAIMLVGGGSLTPGLPQALARAVGLPETRVAVRGRDAIAGVEGAKALLAGPDAVTPIGIAVASRDKSTLGFHLVHVNNRSIRLFHPSKLTVADALLAAGISIKELGGRVGHGLTVSVNGSLQMIRGTFGKPARILVGGEPASLDTEITHRDQITVLPGTPGEPGQATVAEVAPAARERLAVRLNGAAYDLAPLITVNGEPGSPDQQLADNDTVVVRPLRTVEDVLIHLGFDEPGEIRQIRYTLQGETKVVRRPRYLLTLNGGRCEADAPVRSGDSLSVEPTSPLTVREAAGFADEGAATIGVIVNGRPMELPAGLPELWRNGRPAVSTDEVGEGDQLEIRSAGEAPMFAHALAQAGIALQPPPGKSRLVMLLNGEPAEFTTALQHGDRADLIWE
ncbi:MAG TPA: cell division FtsA domain-containing protein [Symbiobacteriaceae bacterium]|nr:cell division FtsA domain-containing protein [Symbiobacteriaceae bacterium]